jgi:hypothetical protein
MQHLEHQRHILERNQEILWVVRVDSEGTKRCPKVTNNVGLHTSLALRLGFVPATTLTNARSRTTSFAAS